MARQLRFFGEEVAKAGVLVAPRLASERPPQFDELEARLGALETELTQLNANSERLSRRCVWVWVWDGVREWECVDKWGGGGGRGGAGGIGHGIGSAAWRRVLPASSSFSGI